MAKKNSILFRADGHAKMGLGHVIRSLALADMLSKDFECHFIIRNPLPSIREQIFEICESIIELPETDNDIYEAEYLMETYLTGSEIVVLDGYHFGTAYQNSIKKKKNKLVCIDDIHAYHFVADAIVNHAPSLLPSIYSCEPYTKIQLGLDYSLLRKPFLEAAQRHRTIHNIENAFICLGGADINNITVKVLKSLLEVDCGIKKANVVIGGANNFIEDVKQLAQNTGTLEIVVHENLSAQQMVGLMENCEIAIVPASSILHEVIAVKMPVISGFYIANQIDVYNGFNHLGLVYGVGDMNRFEDYGKLISTITAENAQSRISLQSSHQTGRSKENFLHLFNQLK